MFTLKVSMTGESSVDADTPVRRGLYGQKPSQSADAARRREFERLAALSQRERVLLALSLKERARLMGVAPGRQHERDGAGK